MLSKAGFRFSRDDTHAKFFGCLPRIIYFEDAELFGKSYFNIILGRIMESGLCPLICIFDSDQLNSRLRCFNTATV